MVCNDQIQVAVPPNGSTEFLPDYMLEGDPNVNCPGGSFQAQVQISSIWLPASGNFVFTPAHIGQNLLARIKELNSGNSCWGNVKVVEGAPLGVNDLIQVEKLALSPNPASHSICLKIASDAPSMAVSIYSMEGRKVSEQTISNGGNLDISALENGLYSVIATTPSGKGFSCEFRKITP